MKSSKRSSLPECIGVIHLPPLPGSPGSAGEKPAETLKRVSQWAVKESLIIQKHGFDGIIIENFGDAPFYKNRVPPETIASMAMIASHVRSECRLPIGINVLRNDAFAALAIASVSGAQFIRVNVLSGVAATDQGLIEGEAASLIREKIRLNADSIKIMADVHVKHARSLSSTHLAIAIEETAGRGGADAVIISGDTTGRAPQVPLIKEALLAGEESHVPVYLGSGAKPELLSHFPKELRIIVGSTLRKGGRAGAPLDERRIQEFMRAFQK